MVSSAYGIWWNSEQDPEENAAPAEVGVSSFTAEITGIESALLKLSERVLQGWRVHLGGTVVKKTPADQSDI